MSVTLNAERPKRFGLLELASLGSLSRNGSLLILTFLTVLAATVRVIATHNDLWLDELISIEIANALHTPWEVFTAVHSGNNHHTNTLYLYFMRGQTFAPVLRYLSVAFGVALVPAGYWLLAWRSRAEGLVLSVLLACSYPLVHFSSEARGYAGAVLGTVLACAALTRWLTQRVEDGGKGRSYFLALTYGIALTLALLSHLTACLIWCPLAIGSLLTLIGRPGGGGAIASWAVLNLLPAGTLVCLYFLDPRFATQLGGPPMTTLHGLGRLLTLGLGWPAKSVTTIWILVIPLMAMATWRLALERKPAQPLALLLGLIFLSPLICVLVLHPAFFSPRYFLVFLPFVYVGLATLIPRLGRMPWGRIALSAALVIFLVGQAHLYAQFLQVGRGQFSVALEYIVTHTASPQVTIASNQDFRSMVELGYYAPHLSGRRQLRYVTDRSSSSLQPDWYIVHTEGYEPPGPTAFQEPGRATWYRVAYFGASELSGQAWTIYSHQPSTHNTSER